MTNYPDDDCIIPHEDRFPADPSAWRGEARIPSELANELEGAASFSRHYLGVDPIELVMVTMSVANRDLIVRALHSLAASEPCPECGFQFGHKVGCVIGKANKN